MPALSQLTQTLAVFLWRQILHHHHRTIPLDDTCLVKLATLGGCTLGENQTVTAATTNTSYHFHVGCFLEHYTRQQQLLTLVSS